MSVPLTTLARHPELVSGSILRLSRAKRRKPQPQRQIGPMRIALVDQVDLPLPPPVFELFFARNRMLHVAKYLIVNKAMDIVSRGEAWRSAIPMLPHAALQIGRYANVKRAAVLARKDVDARLPFLSHVKRLAEKWTLKQVQGDEVDTRWAFLSPVMLNLLQHPLRHCCKG